LRQFTALASKPQSLLVEETSSEVKLSQLKAALTDPSQTKWECWAP
jgi:hypothetical protein